MPHEGYVMQTGGSARRSFIKNNGSDTYYVHGVPGHTHNASAMISVTADYSRQLDEALTISSDWADEDVHLHVGDYTDSVEPDDATELYDRAVERGIGSITLIPENCQHTIKEPARSISEVRTIVSGKDRLNTLTYVNNEFGWVDPISGLNAEFPEEPVMVNIFGYPHVLGDLEGDIPTMNQPVYIGSRSNDFYRYAISSRGSDTAAGAADWDGNVPFYWDPEEFVYRSRPFTKYFGAYVVQSQHVGTHIEIGTGPQALMTRDVLANLALNNAVGAIPIGTVVGTMTIPGQSIHVHGVAGLGFKSCNLQVVDGHAPVVHIPQAGFRVNSRVVDTACD